MTITKTHIATTILAIAAVAAMILAYMPISASAGNGAPNGAHYTLNIIGVPKNKTADMTGNNGRRIFVPDSGKAKILLTEGDFQVLDANGTDANGASFQLPNPDPDGDGTTSYSVFVRALGKPGGWALMQSCYEDATGTWCAADFDVGVSQIEIKRDTGKSTFTNVSRDLLYVDYCAEWAAGTDGVLGTSDDVCTNVNQIALFSNTTLAYSWEYDNYGLKLAQLRFYEVPTETGW